MSFLGDLGNRVKRGLQFVYGSAELDSTRDPVKNLDREHEGQAKPDLGKAKEWDRG